MSLIQIEYLQKHLEKWKSKTINFRGDGKIHDGSTAVHNCASKNSSCCSNVVSFSFKTAILLFVADSIYSNRSHHQP
jgi:hypothetical protein